MAFEGPIMVAGATGRTGKFIVESLRAKGIPVRALARNAEKAQEIAGEGVEIIEGDLRDPDAIERAVTGARAVIISIGAGPQRRMKEDGTPDFFYAEGQTPAIVDYAGNVLVVEAAERQGAQQVVMVSTIGVTNPEHFLNKMGGGRTLDWKLRAENHLRDSGLPYTIVRPGGLEGAKPELVQLVVGTGDTIMGQVARKDVAEVCVQALFDEAAIGKTFELIATEGEKTTDFHALFASV
jgi:uncharacterized protein YbjT (DUF2867 family)